MRTSLPAFNEIWQRKFVKHFFTQLSQFNPQAKIVLGCSGGMDSMLLLHILIALVPERLSVVSVDHQLQQHSQSWSQHVFNTCQSFNIPCHVIAVQVHSGNVEAQARQARYQAFTDHLLSEDVLVLAHHQQDQAETVFLRLLQGTGVQGLAAMQQVEFRQLQQTDQCLRYGLWRPLLDLSKAQIQDWVKQLAFQVMDDPMNHDQHYDRVWCREILWPVLEQRFPAMQSSVVRCAELMQDAEQILQEVLQQDFAKCSTVEQKIVLDQLQQLSKARQRQVLSHWMQADALYRPPLAMVERLINEVILAREDAQSVLHHDRQYFVRFNGDLYRYSDAQWQALQTIPDIRQINFTWGAVVMLACGQFMIKQAHIGLDPALLSEDLTLLPRQGGEKIQFYARSGHKVLKKELQAAKIAPWFRHQIQILMYHTTLLGVFTPNGFWLAQSSFCTAEGWLPQRQSY